MTHRLATNCAKNYCNRTLTVKVIVENVVTCFFWDTVYILLRLALHPSMKSRTGWTELAEEDRGAMSVENV